MERIKRHETREQDIDRARAMAKAGNKYETDAAELRERGKRLLELERELLRTGDTESAKSVRQTALSMLKNAETSKYTANTVEEMAGYDYDRAQHKKRSTTTEEENGKLAS